jgi:hypothetical protein
VLPGNWGAVSEPALEQLTKAAAVRDEAALLELERLGFIFPLTQNAEVYITGCHGFICSKVSFRYKGKLEQFWTYREALSE